MRSLNIKTNITGNNVFKNRIRIAKLFYKTAALKPVLTPLEKFPDIFETTIFTCK